LRITNLGEICNAIKLKKVTALESKSSDLAMSSHLDQSRPKLKIWTPTRLNLMALKLNLIHNYTKTNNELS